jgi:hypothetical protein
MREQQPPSEVVAMVGPEWGAAEDTELLVGVYKHGYGMYDEIFNDAELPHLQKILVIKTTPPPPRSSGGGTHRVAGEGEAKDAEAKAVDDEEGREGRRTGGGWVGWRADGSC